MSAFESRLSNPDGTAPDMNAPSNDAPADNGWGNPSKPADNGWGNNAKPADNGWGNNARPANDGFGNNSRPADNGWGNNARPADNGFGNAPKPADDGWGNNAKPANDGWGSNARPADNGFGNGPKPSNDGWGSNAKPADNGFGNAPRPADDGWGNNAKPANDGFGNNSRPADNGWGNNARPADNGFGNAPKPSNDGWGNNAKPANDGFGNNSRPADNGWGNNARPADNGFGNAPKPSNDGWGNNGRPADNGFGNAPKPADDGWGNNARPADNGFGNAPKPADGGWGNNAKPANDGWGNNAKPANDGWNNNARPADNGFGNAPKPADDGWGNNAKPANDGWGNNARPADNSQQYAAKPADDGWGPSSSGAQGNNGPSMGASTPIDAGPAGEEGFPAASVSGLGAKQNTLADLEEGDYEVDVKLSDLQANPDDPLYSAKSFEDLGLDANILKGIYAMRFTKPSKIQERALPLLLANPPMNMIGQSQSGTGKTAAFVLNLLSRIQLEQTGAPQALVLAPSRELARQIVSVVQMMGQFMEGLQVEAAIPVDVSSRGRVLTAHIVVGTPGTTMDLIRRRQLDPRSIRSLVLDEADNMLDQQGLGDQCYRTRSFLPEQVQVVLFSATFPNNVVEFAAQFAPEANQISLRHDELTIDGIKQLYLECDSEIGKYDALVRLYGLMTIGSSIIFVRTRETALEIERRLNEEGHKVACLTGAFEPAQRDVIIDSFRSGAAKVLIATNVLSRGIDVQTVSLVINYDLPDDGCGNADPQVYLHRIGRTGRFGRVGVSISLVDGRRSNRQVQQISEFFGIDMTALPPDDWDAIERVIKRVIKSSRAGANLR